MQMQVVQSSSVEYESLKVVLVELTLDFNNKMRAVESLANQVKRRAF